MQNLLGLKIDVDTYEGMRRGVPKLLKILERLGVKGTFYLSVGPDASGRAILELLRNPRFFKKMCRTNAVGLYGLRTALYGTILPSPLIALSFPEIVKEIIAQGHEAQFHAWDHRRWQDELPRRDIAWISAWFAQGVEGFERLTGQAPTSFGAPAWLVDERVLAIVKSYNFSYLSCTRAREPFIHEGCGLIEIPSDLPCLEEVGEERGHDIVSDLLREPGHHVLPLHAEVEGGIRQDWFVQLMARATALGYQAVPLRAIHAQLVRETLVVRKHQLAMLPGRAALCAV